MIKKHRFTLFQHYYCRVIFSCMKNGFHLLIGDVRPISGSLQRLGHLINVPQNHALIEANALVSDALGVSHILRALKRINTGSIHESDFEIMTDFWDIEKRIQVALNHFNLWPMDLNKPFYQLSGGQETKILLAKTFILPADFYLFDEPTNNLDRESRQILYQYIQGSSKAMIIVSHNRTLLNLCDKMIEVTTKGINVYGGSYDFYKEQKENKAQAIQKKIQARTEILLKAKKNVQIRMERRQQNEAKGSYDKIALKAQKGCSAKTHRRIHLQSDRKLILINEELLDVRHQLEIDKKLAVCLEATKVPNNKSVKVLSGGKRVRAGLAISLMSVPAPQLIILDEPQTTLT